MTDTPKKRLSDQDRAQIVAEMLLNLEEQGERLELLRVANALDPADAVPGGQGTFAEQTEKYRRGIARIEEENKDLMPLVDAFIKGRQSQ